MNQGQKLDLILKQQKESKDDITYVKSLLENNSKTGQKGAMVRLSNLEADVEEIKVKDRVRLGKAGVVGGVVSALFLYIGKIILKLAF